MIDPNQSRLDNFDNLNEHREILHRGCLDAEKRLTKTRKIVIKANGFRDKHAEK